MADTLGSVVHPLPASEETRVRELQVLIGAYRSERTYRDGGVASRATYFKIKKIATPEELVVLLEEMLHMRPF